ncbi:putative non-specific serine/threonine protein kinase [Helianthus debilis subsp. tardiflorus]
MMRNNICQKHFVLPILFYISVVLVLVSFKKTNAAYRGHQNGGAGNHKCIDKERDALLHFKAYIHQDPYGLLSTWTNEEEATDCCKWSGVTCNNQTGHVTGLELRDGNLEGKLSPSLINLSYLNHLDLNANSFVGTIPMSIGSLTDLRSLRLSDNSFSGTIPRSIGSLTQLRLLDLSYNSFYGTTPQELGNLTNLKKLSLEYMGSCNIGNLDWLGHMSQLEYLYMDGISLAKENNWINVILGLQKLSYLSLCASDLSQVMHPYSYSSINSSSSIVSLYLRNNNLNSSMYRWLSPLTSNRLEYLDLSHNKLHRIPEYLGNLCSLKFLNFYNNSLSKFHEFLNNLSGCTSVALETLIVSNNQLTGSLSDDIQNFASLTSLYLSNNQINGTISEKVWQLPKLQILEVSSNSLKGAISANIGKTKISSIYLSNNSLEGVPLEAHMSKVSTIETIDLSSCKLGPRFPKWIQTLKNLTHINIANTGISDTIAEEFWNTWPSRLMYLNLSSNNITGRLTDLLSNFDPELSILDLNSNNFYGPIPNVPSTLERLDLSRNKFYGEISFLCQIVGGFMYFLDLSHNSFTGQIPDCLWHFKELIVLSLGHNNLSGRLPTSIKYLINLEVLYLYKNNFSGELPLSLKNCTKLTFLELGVNNFSGYVPDWIGGNLLGLYALSLTSNNFFGAIPLQLCQLTNLQILDLSIDNLYGSIPSCLNNLTTMAQDGFSLYQNVHFYSCPAQICIKKVERSTWVSLLTIQ